MEDIKVQKARPADVDILTQIQKETFNHDCLIHNMGESSGPIGYSSHRWNRMMVKQGLYFKIVLDSKIVGGIVLFRNSPNHMIVGRIFIHPDYQNKGIGTQIFPLIEVRFPKIVTWSLDTPKYALRNQHFYEKLGYKKIGEQTTRDKKKSQLNYMKRTGSLKGSTPSYIRR